MAKLEYSNYHRQVRPMNVVHDLYVNRTYKFRFIHSQIQTCCSRGADDMNSFNREPFKFLQYSVSCGKESIQPWYKGNSVKDTSSQFFKFEGQGIKGTWAPVSYYVIGVIIWEEGFGYKTCNKAFTLQILCTISLSFMNMLRSQVVRITSRNTSRVTPRTSPSRVGLTPLSISDPSTTLNKSNIRAILLRSQSADIQHRQVM